MNIKTLTNNITAVDRDTSSGVISKSVKSENTSPDRDPNGQRERDKDQNQKEFLNDEEMQKALDKLNSFPGIKDSNLKVELVVKEVSRYVLITDHLGKTVRRIPESELWPLIQEKGTQTGHLIDKTG